MEKNKAKLVFAQGNANKNAKSNANGNVWAMPMAMYFKGIIKAIRRQWCHFSARAVPFQCQSSAISMPFQCHL